MTQGLAKIAFLLVSVAVHMAAFTLLPEGSQGAGGHDGDAGVTLQSAGASVANMVAEWEATPDITTATTAMVTPNEPKALSEVQTPSDAPPTKAIPARLTTSLTDKAPQQPLQLDAAPVAVAARVDAFAAPRIDDVIPKFQSLQRPATAPSRPLALNQPAADAAPRPQPSPTNVLASIRPKSRPTSEAAALRARGRGPAPIEGTGRVRAASSGLSADQLRALEAEWASAITRRIQRAQRRPEGRSDDGRVLVTMVIARSGQLEQVRVAQSSGSSALDQAALATVRRAAPFPAAPNGLEKPRYPASQWIAFRRR